MRSIPSRTSQRVRIARLSTDVKAISKAKPPSFSVLPASIASPLPCSDKSTSVQPVKRFSLFQRLSPCRKRTTCIMNHLQPRTFPLNILNPAGLSTALYLRLAGPSDYAPPRSSQQSLVHRQIAIRKTAEGDIDRGGAGPQRFAYGSNCDLRGLFDGIAVNSRAYRREGDRLDTMIAGDHHAASIASCEKRSLPGAAAAPYGADRADYVLRRECVSARDDGFPGPAASEPSTLCQ